MGKLAGLQDNGRVFVSRSSLEALAATRAEWISIVTAAGIAGVGTKVIQGALAAGQIEQREGPTAHPSISRSSLEQWARTYEPPQPKPRPRPMSLPPDDEHDWVGPDVVAERLGLTRSRVRQLARAERLPMVQRGARWWMTVEHLAQVVAARAATMRQEVAPDSRPSGPVAPMSGVVTSVTGRGPGGAGRGLPTASKIELTLDEQKTVVASLNPWPDGTELSRAALLGPIEPAEFESCPICLTSAPTSDEHVPPTALGGVKMTRTCPPCNNRLGSRTEADMKDWFDQAARIRYFIDGVDRPVGQARTLLRESDDGFVLLPERDLEASAAVRDHLSRGGSLRAVVTKPRPAEYLNGFLKSAYLAACLAMQGVPDIPSAHEIRSELLAARDARRREVRLGPHAKAMRVYRTGEATVGPHLGLLVTEGDEPELLISLAGAVLVSWPFPEVTLESLRRR